MHREKWRAIYKKNLRDLQNVLNEEAAILTDPQMLCKNIKSYNSSPTLWSWVVKFDVVCHKVLLGERTHI